MRTGRSWMVQVALVGGLASGVAFAQANEEDIEIAGEEIEIVTPADEPEEIPAFDVKLKGGAAGYTGEMGDSTAVGPLFGVVASVDAAQARGLNVTPNLRVEAAYEGNTNPVSDDFGEGTVWRHNVSTLAKAGVRVGRFDPFVGVGVGASYVNVTEEAEDAGFRNDFIAEMPLAAGLEYRFGTLSAGARATYRPMFGEEFTENVGAEGSSGGLLSGSVTLGGRF